MFGSEIKCVVGGGGGGGSLFYNGGIRNLIMDYMLPKSLILVSRAASVIGDMRPPTVCTFWGFLSVLGSFCANELHYTQHVSVFSTILYLGPKSLALETLLDRGCYSEFLDLQKVCGMSPTF